MPTWSDDCRGIEVGSLTTPIRRLLTEVAETGSDRLSDGRQRLMDLVGELVDADIGLWAWGVGQPGTNSTLPLAVLHYRCNEEQKTRMLEIGMRPALNAVHRKLSHLFDENRLLCVTRHNIHTEEEWEQMPPYREAVQAVGMDSFLLAIRYSTDESWSNLLLLRRIGRSEFTPREQWLAGLALSALPPLQSTAAELPAAEETVAHLTPRQRTVAVMLLDGQSRKQIAAQLQLSEHTVNDHIKLIYRHLGIHSLNELAARLLRDT